MVTLSFTIFSGQKNYNRAHMLFQVLCGFEPIFYTTHPNEEPVFYLYILVKIKHTKIKNLEKRSSLFNHIIFIEIYMKVHLV